MPELKPTYLLTTNNVHIIAYPSKKLVGVLFTDPLGTDTFISIPGTSLETLFAEINSLIERLTDVEKYKPIEMSHEHLDKLKRQINTH